MATEVPGLAGTQHEMDTPPEETMEYWLSRSVGDIEEGEVIRGRVVEVRTGDVIVDIGYKSEGAIPIEEFRHTGAPKVGDEIEVFLEAKEDSEGLRSPRPSTRARRWRGGWSRS